MSMVDLPTREEIQKAISHLWRGGGIASLIVNVIREREGSLEEAVAVAERMARRAAAGQNYVTREIVDEHLESVRASAALYKKNSKVQEPKYDMWKCVFSNVLDCPQCSEMEGRPYRHGDLMPVLDQAHGWHHLKPLMRDPALMVETHQQEGLLHVRNPRECDCGFDPTDGE